MANTLSPTTPLNGYSVKIGKLEISEVTDLSILSMAIPKNEKQQFEKTLSSTFKCALPKIGKSTISTAKSGTFKACRMLRLQHDLCFALLKDAEPDLIGSIPKNTSNSAYITDQTSNWVCIRLEGPNTLQALERVCKIDLRPNAFPKNSIARTDIEHLGAIIICEKKNKFLLISASSSAASFLHVITLSAENIS